MKPIHLTPYEDRVLIDPDEAPKLTDSGLIIPDNVQENHRPAHGLVVAVGPGKYENGILVPVGCKVGEKVYYSKFAGVPIEDLTTKKTYLVMRFTDVFLRDEAQVQPLKAG